jgi:hypothetical protein
MHGSTAEKRGWLIVLAVLDLTQSALGHGRNREAQSAFDYIRLVRSVAGRVRPVTDLGEDAVLPRQSLGLGLWQHLQ